MILKLVMSILMAFVLAIQGFIPAVPLPDEPTAYIEAEPEYNEMRNVKKISGVNGSEFYISAPDEEKYTPVSTDIFGMSEENYDNTDSFIKAINYCREHPFTKLIISDGVYYFRQSGKIDMNKISDCYIDGAGAKFIFTSTGYQINIRNSDTVEIHGLSVDWDRENDPIEDIVRVKSADKKKHTVEFEFILKDSADENMTIAAVTQCDKNNNYTFGKNGGAKEKYLYSEEGSIKNITKTGNNTLSVEHNGCLDSLLKDEFYIIRHYVYDGTVFSVTDESKNITFDSVNIFGSSGMAYVISGGASHFQIINSYIGVDPEKSESSFVSLASDAIHIANTRGCFLIENCDISRQGDDALNVHDNLGYIDSVSNNTVTLYGSALRMNKGDTIKFKDNGFNNIDFSVEIISSDNSGTLKTITFDKDISEYVKKGYIAYNTAVNSGNYVIRGNYIHENRARGFLLQSDNGLCINNRFYKTEMQAIKVVMDIIPSLWQEGTGVNNLVIRNNSFENCDVIETGEIINISTSIDGKTADCEPFTNIEISGNTFSDFNKKLMNINNVNNLSVCDNTITTKKAKNNIHFGKYCDNVTIENNQWNGKNSIFAEVVTSDKFSNAVKLNKNAELFRKF